MGTPIPTEESPRLLYPADRTAFQYTGPGRPILVPPITPLVIYADQAATIPADLVATGTSDVIPNSTVYTDESGMLPEFLGPYGVTRLWAVAQVDGQSMEPYPLDAAFGPRIDALAAATPTDGPGTVNTIRSGSGAPSGALGADGDWYIDKVAKAIYGPKTAGLWGSSTSLIGPPGPAGSGGGGGSSYAHYQYASTDTWDITHSLGYVPNVLVVDSAGTHVHGDVRVLSSTRIQVQFSVPFSGTAFLS